MIDKKQIPKESIFGEIDCMKNIKRSEDAIAIVDDTKVIEFVIDEQPTEHTSYVALYKIYKNFVKNGNI